MSSHRIARGAAAAALGGLVVVTGIASASTSGASPPVVRALPSIAGRTVEGQTLTARNGEWAGSRPMTLAYEWYR